MKTFAISPMTKINVTFLPDPVIQLCVCEKDMKYFSTHTHWCVSVFVRACVHVCLCAYVYVFACENEQAAANHSGGSQPGGLCLSAETH